MLRLLKRSGIFLASIVIGFFGGLLQSSNPSHISSDHVVLNIWLISWAVFGILSSCFGTTTKFGSRVYWLLFGLWVILFFTHEFFLWPAKCITGPC